MDRQALPFEISLLSTALGFSLFLFPGVNDRVRAPLLVAPGF